MSKEEDDILGISTPRRARKVEREDLMLSTEEAKEVRYGVSVNWLATVFRLTRTKVQKALENCPPLMDNVKGKGFRYDVATAAEFLVVPKHTIRTQLRNLKPNDLPDHLREGAWNARLKEQKYRAIAGELWPTERVMDVFGEAFKTIKSQVQLWATTVEQQTATTPEQRAILTQMADQLLDDIHKALVKQSQEKTTPSQLAELDIDA